MRCGKCHRLLKDPKSIAIGYGPECRGKMTARGWKFPEAKYRVRDGRVIFLGLAGKVEPPSVNTEAMPKKKVAGRRLKVNEVKDDNE